MRKKTNSAVKLVLITSVLASCSSPKQNIKEEQQRVYMRADSTAPYTEVTQQYQQQRTGGAGIGSALLWYMAFRHLGGGMGYASNGIHPSSVSGTNKAKAGAYARSGFGNTARSSAKSSSFGS